MYGVARVDQSTHIFFNNHECMHTFIYTHKHILTLFSHSFHPFSPHSHTLTRRGVPQNAASALNLFDISPQAHGQPRGCLYTAILEREREKEIECERVKREKERDRERKKERKKEKESERQRKKRKK